MIKLYGAEWCEPCQQIKRLLEKFGIPFEYIETDDVGVVIPKLVLDDGREIIGMTDGLPEYLRKLGKEHREVRWLFDMADACYMRCPLICPNCGQKPITLANHYLHCESCGMLTDYDTYNKMREGMLEVTCGACRKRVIIPGHVAVKDLNCPSCGHPGDFIIGKSSKKVF